MYINLMDNQIKTILMALREKRATFARAQTDEEQDLDAVIGYLSLHEMGKSEFESDAAFQIAKAKAHVRDAINCLDKVAVKNVEGTTAYTMAYREKLLGTLIILMERNLKGF